MGKHRGDFYQVDDGAVSAGLLSLTRPACLIPEADLVDAAALRDVVLDAHWFS